MIDTFEAGNETYSIDSFGVVHQLNPQPFEYTPSYCSTYDSEPYRRKSEILQAMRFGFATAAHGRQIDSLLDIGFANGAFLNFAKQQVENVFGHDISGVPIPEGCTFLDSYHDFEGVVCFHDVLEHIPDLSFLKAMKAETLSISLPHYPGKDLFPMWVHRKKNEHLHHFTPDSLRSFMKSMGWNMVSLSKHEDMVRKRDCEWNIISAAFKR